MTLSDNQNLRYELLKANNYDVEAAKSCYDFVAGGDPDCQKDAEYIEDGVYFMMHDTGSVKYHDGIELQPEEMESCYGIGVKLGSKSLVISVKETETVLTKQEGGTRFITGHAEAIADWDGEAGTDDIYDILTPSAKTPSGWYIPSLGQLYFIYQHILEITKALLAVGGDTFAGWYWSSTAPNEINAWYLMVRNGFSGFALKYEERGKLRPVAPFFPSGK